MSETLKQELRSLILEIAEKDDISDDTHFKEVGIDSMMGVEIVAAIERQYKIKIEDAELQEVSTLNKSYDLVKKRSPAFKRPRSFSEPRAAECGLGVGRVFCDRDFFFIEARTIERDVDGLDAAVACDDRGDDVAGVFSAESGVEVSVDASSGERDDLVARVDACACGCASAKRGGHVKARAVRTNANAEARGRLATRRALDAQPRVF